MQRLKSLRPQYQHSPQGTVKEPSTRSPGRNLLTSGDTASTTPTNSCPRTLPGLIPGMRPWITCRSLPQMAVVVTLTRASPGSLRDGDGTSSTTTPSPVKRTALTGAEYLRGAPPSSTHSAGLGKAEPPACQRSSSPERRWAIRSRSASSISGEEP